MYKHVEIDILQQAKRANAPCGDVVVWNRTSEDTLLALCDGVGSGVFANLAATFAANRLIQLIREDFSPREAFQAVVAGMHSHKTNGGPYAALTLCRILNDGQTTVLNYESPAPVLAENRFASVLPQRMLVSGGEVIAESLLHLEKNSTLLLVSDGITQAGMGSRFPKGWGETGVANLVNRFFQSNVVPEQWNQQLMQQAWMINQQRYHDDTSIVRLGARLGNVVNILSGPPQDKTQDEKVVRDFLSTEGIKIVCGATTASLVALVLKQGLKMEKSQAGYIEPPRYQLPGIDVVTEGAITLNQVYNLLDEPLQASPNQQSGVASILSLLNFADRVNLFVGQAINPAHADIKFTQMGVLPRLKIIPLISEKLRAQGKLVVETKL